MLLKEKIGPPSPLICLGVGGGTPAHTPIFNQPFIVNSHYLENCPTGWCRGGTLTRYLKSSIPGQTINYPAILQCKALRFKVCRPSDGL